MTSTATRMRTGCRGTPGEPAARGTSDLVALALVALDLPAVSRVTLRALCFDKPTGERSARAIRTQFRRALRIFEQAGWVMRGDRDLVHVLDPDGLRKWINAGTDVDEARAGQLLDVAYAAGRLRSGKQYVSARHRELVAVERLMRAVPCGPGRKGVRVVHRGGAL